MEYSNKTFKKELLALADKKYKEFSEKLGIGQLEMLGIRIPVLKKLAKELSKTNWQEFFDCEENFCAEVVTLKGMCLGYAKLEFDYFLKYLKNIFDCYYILSKFFFLEQYLYYPSLMEI